MDISKKFGKRVKELREKRSMSQGDVAKKIAVHPSYISQIERGVQNVSLRGMERLAKVFNVPINTLLK
ncbi:MAG: helix-turn-helix transcriptional regulator [Patescibacteria group bacterium]